MTFATLTQPAIERPFQSAIPQGEIAIGLAVEFAALVRDMSKQSLSVTQLDALIQTVDSLIEELGNAARGIESVVYPR